MKYSPLTPSLEDFPMSEPIDISNSAPVSKVLWTGSLLDTRCIFAIGPEFNISNEWNEIHFTLTATDYQYKGVLKVKVTGNTWVQDLREYVCELYIKDIMRFRDEYEFTIH